MIENVFFNTTYYKLILGLSDWVKMWTASSLKLNIYLNNYVGLTSLKKRT